MIDRECCQTLTESALNVVQKKPDDIAFEYVYLDRNRETLTYRELVRTSLSVAASLLGYVNPGERVLLPCYHEKDFHIGFYACLFARCIAVPCHSPRVKRKLSEYGLNRFRHIAEDSQAKIMLAPKLLIDRVGEYFSQVDGLKSLDLVNIEDAVNGALLGRAYAATYNMASVHDITGNIVSSNTVRDNINNREKKAIENVAEHNASIDSINSSNTKVGDVIARADDIAYLQYTSGSTSNPKGVVITHRNIINNQRYMAKKANLDDSIVSINWLPLYHDMGLTLGCVTGIWLNCRSIIMSPMVFISKPEIWLKEISSRSNVMSGGPNFAYTHSLAKIDDEVAQDLDLSGWRIAINGSEPIVTDTLYQFDNHFGQCGFSFNSFYAAYGMAEATLFVSGAKKGRGPVIRHYDKVAFENKKAIRVEQKNQNTVSLVGCGNNFMHTVIAIVDTKTMQPLSEGCVGEIWISSDSASKEYWENPQQSKDVFGQTLNGYGDSVFFRSGDLGFIDDGELFICGRIKELIINNGANFYPQDIERLAQSAHGDFVGLRAAAFTRVDAGEERLELAMECTAKLLKENLSWLIKKIVSLINAEFQLKLHDIHLVKIGTIPITTSGKVQRTLCRDLIHKKKLAVHTSLLSDTKKNLDNYNQGFQAVRDCS